MLDHDIRHFCRHRHDVVGHRGVLKLAGIVIDAMLVQCVAQAVYDRAALLFRDKLRVDHPPAILDQPVVQHLDEAGIAIDLDIGGMRGIRENIVAHPEPFGCNKNRVIVVRQFVGAQEGYFA